MVKVTVDNGKGKIREFEGDYYLLNVGNERESASALEGIFNSYSMIKIISCMAAENLKRVFDVEPETPAGEMVKMLFKTAFDIFFDGDGKEIVRTEEIITRMQKAGEDE